MRRFSIRDLFSLTLFVAMGLGWWVDRSQVERHWDKCMWDMKQDYNREMGLPVDVPSTDGGLLNRPRGNHCERPYLSAIHFSTLPDGCQPPDPPESLRCPGFDSQSVTFCG